MQVAQIFDFIDTFAPFKSAAEWDNPGLLVGNSLQEVSGIITALDVTVQVLEEAESLGCNLVVSHHPVIFNPIKNVLAGSVPYEAARRNISILCAHTNLDIAPGGVNTALAAKLGLGEIKAISASDPFGLVGKLPQTMTPSAFAKELTQALGLSPRYNPLGRSIVTVGLCGGAGADLLDIAIGEGDTPDAFVTADVRQHEYLAAAAKGITLYDAGHYATENPVIPAITEMLQRAFPSTRVLQSTVYCGQLL